MAQDDRQKKIQSPATRGLKTRMDVGQTHQSPRLKKMLKLSTPLTGNLELEVIESEEEEDHQEANNQVDENSDDFEIPLEAVKEHLVQSKKPADKKEATSKIKQRGGVKREKKSDGSKLQYPSLFTRNVGKSFMETIEKIKASEKKTETVRQMGFGQFLNLSKIEFPHKLAYWVLENFDEVQCKLKLKSGDGFYINKDDIHRVFGISKSPAPVERKSRKESPEIWERWSLEFQGLADVRSSHIAIKIESWNEDEGMNPGSRGTSSLFL